MTSLADVIPTVQGTVAGLTGSNAFLQRATIVGLSKSVYMYIYISNETPNVPVFFDNLQVTHIRGPLLEETHYYSFGLAMAGISSNSLQYAISENRKGYNGNDQQEKEFVDGTGLDVYDFNARFYDQQLGRFMQNDPEVDKFNQERLSPYHFTDNNPVLKSDPTGRCPDCPPGFAPAIPWVIDGIATLIELAVVAVASNETGKQIAKVANSPKTLGGEGIVTGSPFGIPTGTTFRKLYSEQAQAPSFDRQSDTKSETRKQSLNKAKEENGIPRSQQSDRTIKPNTSEGAEAGLDNRNIRQYEYNNSKGVKVVIREDKPVKYKDGGKGDQGPHFNPGQKPLTPKDLNQHHYFEFSSRISLK